MSVLLASLEMRRGFDMGSRCALGMLAAGCGVRIGWEPCSALQVFVRNTADCVRLDWPHNLLTSDAKPCVSTRSLASVCETIRNYAFAFVRQVGRISGAREWFPWR